ncbi:MAG: hypothetical protein JJ964_07100 [Rhizobiales bacterium]|nr:hypothetical protein [Hyphomicrobiales bacterium]
MKKIHTPILLGNLLFILLSSVFLPSLAKAEIKDYMIRRMIILKTECKLDELKRSEPSEGGFKYLAICENVSFYPDGVTINCPDKDVETSCKIKTKAKKFDQLNLLKNSVSQDHEEAEKKTEK